MRRNDRRAFLDLIGDLRVRAWRAVAPGVSLVLLLLPRLSTAQFTPYDPGDVPKDLGGAINDVLKVVLTLVGVLALGFLVYGGFQYIVAATTGRGEREVAVAKQIITTAIVGIVIIGLALAIVNFVFQALGRPPAGG